jgi:NitT/TauT family transport system substrate-binding protein
MKKIMGLLMVLLFVLSLSGCKDDPENVVLKIMVPLGSPALSQTYMEYMHPNIGENVTYDIEVVSGTDPLIAAFGSGSHDIIYAPTNLGAKLYKTGVAYKFAATVVTGNLYLVTGTDEEFDLDSLDGKELVVFGQNATPDIILQTIIADQDYDTPPTITYVDSVGTANATLISDPSKIVLLAEPVLSVADLNIENLQTIDLQEAWRDLTSSESYPQAGIFIKDGTDEVAVAAYLREVELSIEEALTNPTDVATMASELEYGFPVPVLTSAIARSGLEFITADDSKAALIDYFGYIIILNPALIGDTYPESGFYYN